MKGSIVQVNNPPTDNRQWFKGFLPLNRIIYVSFLIIHKFFFGMDGEFAHGNFFDTCILN